MSRFTGHLGLVQLEYSNGRPACRGGLALFWLPDPLPYELGEEGSGRWLTVPRFDRGAYSDVDVRGIELGVLRPRGVTDLGSVPWFGRWAVAPSDPAAKAFVLHDDGYGSRGESWRVVLGRAAKRSEVDAELRISMKALGAPAWKRSLVYHAVDLGGGAGWGR